VPPTFQHRGITPRRCRAFRRSAATTGGGRCFLPLAARKEPWQAWAGRDPPQYTAGGGFRPAAAAVSSTAAATSRRADPAPLRGPVCGIRLGRSKSLLVCVCVGGGAAVAVPSARTATGHGATAPPSHALLCERGFEDSSVRVCVWVCELVCGARCGLRGVIKCV